MIYSEFDENLKLVASSWQRNTNKNKLFFGVLDFENAQSVFVKVKINISYILLFICLFLCKI
jgi:hypothetical protein